MAQALRGDCDALPGMVGQDPLMLALFQNTREVAPTDMPVMIVGETGTGKELIARAIHQLAGHTDFERFVDVNCAALPEHLCEGELFGSERGAFSGAHQQRDGLLDMANGGTLFLDELCSMPVLLQAKLLRALEQKEFRRVGGRRRIASNFRVVAAVSEPVQDLIKDGRLRPDLAFRISAAVVSAPALRSRRSDIGRLVRSFLKVGTERLEMTEEAMDALARYEWPGNVRELKNLMDRLRIKRWIGPVGVTDVMAVYPALAAEELKPDALIEILEQNEWSVSGVARLLGIPRSTLRSRMSAFGLRRPAA